MTALASRYLDRLKEKRDFESPNRELTKLTKVPCASSFAPEGSVEKNASQGPDTELTKLTKPENGTFVSLVSSPNGHSKLHFSSEPRADEGSDRHWTWLITLPTGERFSSMFCPPKTRAEALAIYPGALVEIEVNDPAPAPDASEPHEPDTAPKAICARCGHWRPDTVNPDGGLGRCTIAAPASKRPGSLWPWPDAEIHCTRFQETNS